MKQIIEERVLIDGEFRIGATIARPYGDKKRPLILLIMGTGKLDRDGNQIGFKSNIYKTLSDMFVNLGYVCVRYDKRGTHESGGKFNSTGLSDLVLDSLSVIQYAKELSFVDETKIIACGHSEGAMIATLLTKHEKLERIILLGGACMCLKSAMEYQNYKLLNEIENKKGVFAWYLKKMVSKQKVEKQLSALFERAKNAKKDTFFFNGAFMPAKWIKEHGALTNEDFVKMIEEYDGKVLAITGKADLQADYTCLERIKEFEHVTTYSPEKLNHMLRDIDDKNSFFTVKKQYRRLLKKPMSQEVASEIEEFLKN